jgi:hypothetical protein
MNCPARCSDAMRWVARAAEPAAPGIWCRVEIPERRVCCDVEGSRWECPESAPSQGRGPPRCACCGCRLACHRECLLQLPLPVLVVVVVPRRLGSGFPRSPSLAAAVRVARGQERATSGGGGARLGTAGTGRGRTLRTRISQPAGNPSSRERTEACSMGRGQDEGLQFKKKVDTNVFYQKNAK